MTSNQHSRNYQRLPRAEVVKAVERKSPSRIPLIMAHWWGEGLFEQYGARLEQLGRYPEDTAVLGIPKLDCNAMGLSWDLTRSGGHDSGGIIDRLGFWAGFDVQHTLREGTPAEVRAEVRFLIDTFDRKEGGMCIAAGNGIVAGTPFENIEAFLDEALSYGTRHREGYAR